MTDKRLFGGSVRSALIHAATRYDVRQSKGKRYNPYALGQYFARIDDICADIDNGASPRDAIVAACSGALLNELLRAIHVEKPSTDEWAGTGKFTYQPVAGDA